MNAIIDHLTKELENELISFRRDLHSHPETGWNEYRTAVLISKYLSPLDMKVLTGEDVLLLNSRMGLPGEAEQQFHMDRALKTGITTEELEPFKNGRTGLVGIITGTAAPGQSKSTVLHDPVRSGEKYSAPVIGFRFDIDALPIQECKDPGYRPFDDGFSSEYQGMMHACGHDIHAAIGIGLAKVLSRMRDSFSGTVKIIFQPAEEGVRGAKAMVDSGVLDDIDYLAAFHVRTGSKTGEITCSQSGYLATSKFDVTIHGVPAHAGGSPQSGANAILAAAAAIQNLYAIPRHSEGRTRINVGRIEGGSGRNIIADHVELWIETRGDSTDLNDYMYTSAKQILENAAAMYGCTITIKPMGGAPSAVSDNSYRRMIEAVAETMDSISVLSPVIAGGSEDFTYMMQRVQEQGGQAVHFSFGADLLSSPSGVSSSGSSKTKTTHVQPPMAAHTSRFDVDESSFRPMIELLARIVMNLCGRET